MRDLLLIVTTTLSVGGALIALAGGLIVTFKRVTRLEERSGTGSLPGRPSFASLVVKQYSHLQWPLILVGIIVFFVFAIARDLLLGAG